MSQVDQQDMSHAELTARFRQAGIPKASVDRAGDVVAVNDAWCALFGRSREDVLGRHLLEGSPPDQLAENSRLVQRFLDGQLEDITLVRQLQHVDGSPVHVTLNAHTVRAADGSLLSYAVAALDVTALVTTQRHLAEQEARWRALLRHATDLALISDADGTITYVSPAVVALFGYPEEAVVRSSGMSFVHPDDLPDVERALEEVAAAPGSVTTVVLRIKHADGHWVWASERLSNLLDVPEVRGIVANLRDVTRERESAAELRRLALYDSATGLPNRTLLQDRLAQLVSGSTQGLALLVLSVEVDGGAVSGAQEDALMTSTAGRLRDAADPTDTVARVHASTFAVLREVPVVGHDAAALAQDVQDLVCAPVSTAEGVLSPVCTGGLAEAAAPDAALLLDDALLALRRARARGRGQVERFSPALRLRASARGELVDDLRRDLAAGRVLPSYQPVVDIESGTPVGWEALVRWHRPGLPVALPGEFLHLAEEAGLLETLSNAVLAQACRDAAGWPTSFGSLSVNVCIGQLCDPGFPDTVVALLERTGLEPARLVLELSERDVVGDPARARAALEALRPHGVRAALDDFGTGWSNLLNLTTLPVEVVKIDRAFVQDLSKEPDKHAVVASTLALVRRLGAHAVAEGVETPGQAAALLELGCTHAQGFLWSRAVPATEVAALVHRAPRPLRSFPVDDLELEVSLPPRVVARLRELERQSLSLHSMAGALNQDGLRTSDDRRWTGVRVASALAELARADQARPGQAQ